MEAFISPSVLPLVHRLRIARLASILSVVVLLFAALAPHTFFAAQWPALDPKELSDSKPQVDPEAGAEILLRETTITHAKVDELIRRYYVRAKIYTERGLESFTKIDLPYDDNGSEISEIIVRTIKPDGEIVELTRKDVYDREVIKVGKERIKVKSFSPAGLQPGAILEYAYTEVRSDWTWYVTMSFQSALPARIVRYKFLPIDITNLSTYARLNISARTLFFNCPEQKMKTDTDGYYRFEMRNVAATVDEPYSPPTLNSEPTALFCYSLQKRLPPKEYWADLGKTLHETMTSETKASALVRSTLAALALVPTDSDEQKLRKLYDYCRTKLVNHDQDTTRFTSEQRRKFKPNDNASATLKAGHGNGDDIIVAFVALARAAGFDARFALCNDRSFMFFNVALTEPFITNDLLAAVQLGGQWQFFDPGALYLPFATPSWQNSSTYAVIAQPKDAAPVAIKASNAEVSQQKRKALLRLDAEGTLEGDVTIEYSGHQEYARKRDLDDKTTLEREKYVREEVQEYLKLAEVTEVRVENADNPVAPLKISFHLRVPEYADRTGSRLFFQPAVFQKNTPPRLTAATRRHHLTSRFPYLDSDEIRIEPPDGFDLEEANSPGSLDMDEMGSYALSIGIIRNSKTLFYRRTLTFHATHLDVSTYPAVKDAFEIIHQRDGHALTLKRRETTPAPGAPTPTSPPTASPSSTP